MRTVRVPCPAGGGRRSVAPGTFVPNDGGPAAELGVPSDAGTAGGRGPLASALQDGRAPVRPIETLH